jgi:hypothetical protein
MSSGFPLPWKTARIQAIITAGTGKVVGIDRAIVTATDTIAFLSTVTSAIKTSRHVLPSLSVASAALSHPTWDFVSVSGEYDQLVFYSDSGSDATSEVFYLIEHARTSIAQVLGGLLGRL